MIFSIFFFIFGLAHADPSWRWTNATKIVEKHEFYTNNEMITRPANSWQTLFAVLYNDANLKTFKDCLFFKVPGEEPGILKLKTIGQNDKCESFIFSPGDEQWTDIKALQFSVEGKFLSLSITNKKFEVEQWSAALFNVFSHPEPKMLMSSAEYRSPKVMYLTPYKGTKMVRPQKSLLQDLKVCHEVSDDCKILSPSVCSQCPNGWHEITNGCPQSPKFCGQKECGQKNGPACRRGFKYQKKEIPFSCRDDSSFAYCAKGLTIQCQGNLPYCL